MSSQFDSDAFVNAFTPLQRRQISPELREVESTLRERALRRFIEVETARRTTMLDSLGDDQYEVGAIISFKKQFTPGGVPFTYAAVKRSDGKWATTSSRHTKPLTWDELTLFLVGGQVPTDEIVRLLPMIKS